MEEIYLPTLHYFENKNRFSGSCGTLRFMLNPAVVMKTPKEVDFNASEICGVLWHGIYCLEKSAVEEEASFPLSTDGLAAIRDWLNAHK